MQKKRNINLDIIRDIAVFSVLSVHFFLNNGFYGEIVNGRRMFVMIIMRTAFMVCVPLFALLTGFLMNKKTLSKNYYSGLKKTYLTFLLASVCNLIFKYFYYSESLGIRTAIIKILNFSAAGYSWYIEMYIGLFLFIPFLNILYHGLKNKEQKKWLIFTLLFLTTFPSILNIWGVDGGLKTILFPTENTRILEILPDYWEILWPITYYYIGAFINEYGIKIKLLLNVFMYIGSLLLFSIFNYYRSYNSTFVWAKYNTWQGFQSAILSVLLFLFILQLDTTKIAGNKIINKSITKISEISLGIYLVSSIFDAIVYDKLNLFITEVPKKLESYIIVVPIVFLLSFITAYVLDHINRFIFYGINNIKGKVALYVNRQ